MSEPELQAQTLVGMPSTANTYYMRTDALGLRDARARAAPKFPIESAQGLGCEVVPTVLTEWLPDVCVVTSDLAGLTACREDQTATSEICHLMRHLDSSADSS